MEDTGNEGQVSQAGRSYANTELYSERAQRADGQRQDQIHSSEPSSNQNFFKISPKIPGKDQKEMRTKGRSRRALMLGHKDSPEKLWKIRKDSANSGSNQSSHGGLIVCHPHQDMEASVPQMFDIPQSNGGDSRIVGERMKFPQ